ncbi:MAG: energy-coupled thiamine transporter ThiT [Clostridiales bacterium]|nr:energy-coupled thiamine transporter ThiT [Clostridiales bacterium]
MKKINITEISMAVALSFVLTFVSFFHMPHGGSITLAMVPIIQISFKRGCKSGIFTGAIVAILKILSGTKIYHPLSIILDYILAYGSIGIAGLFQKLNSLKMFFGVLLSFFLRFIFHVISGATLFKNYIPINKNPWIYSCILNTSYLFPELIITLIVVFALNKIGKK